MANFDKLHRREFLKATGLGMAISGLGCATTGVSQSMVSELPQIKKGKTPKNVIFMVIDGMSTGVMTLADPLSRLTRDKGTFLNGMLENPNVTHGYFDTRSLSSMVTDSAAGSVAWGSGSLVFNGSVNYLPDGTALTPIHHLVKDKGLGTGLVTSTRVTHATPAGFASQAKSRGEEVLIAPQYLDVVDVILGGGTQFFDGEQRLDGQDIFGEYQKAGYGIWRNKMDLMKRMAVPDKLLGTFTDSHLPYAIDYMNSPDLMKNTPTLAELTRVALGVLSRNDKGFLLQVEGGRIDHGAHGNDAPAALYDQIHFDDALGVALEFYEKNPDTLIIVTSDHGNANPGLNGLGMGYFDSTESFERLANAKSSLDEVRSAMVRNKASLTPSDVSDMIKEAFAVEITKKEAEALTAAAKGNPPTEWNNLHIGLTGLSGQILGNYWGIQWTGTNHTSDHVMVAAIGPGQERFHGLRKNTEWFNIVTEFMGITHKNPSMSIDEGRALLSQAPRYSHGNIRQA